MRKLTKADFTEQDFRNAKDGTKMFDIQCSKCGEDDSFDWDDFEEVHKAGWRLHIDNTICKDCVKQVESIKGYDVVLGGCDECDSQHLAIVWVIDKATRLPKYATTVCRDCGNIPLKLIATEITDLSLPLHMAIASGIQNLLDEQLLIVG
jgi:hypothetical protein